MEKGKIIRERYVGPIDATDIIIRYKGDYDKEYGIVLIERKYAPLGLAVPGGMAEDMTLQANAVKEAKEETGLDIIIDSPTYSPLAVLSKIEQDPREHIASVCYTAKGFGKVRPHADEDAKEAYVFTLQRISDMIYDESVKWAFEHHKDLLKIYMLRCGSTYHGFRLKKVLCSRYNEELGRKYDNI